MAPFVMPILIYRIKLLIERLAPIALVLAGGGLLWLLWPRGGSLRSDRARLTTQERIRRRRDSIVRDYAATRAARARAEAAGLPFTGLMILGAQLVAGGIVGLVSWRYTGNFAVGAIMAVGGWQIPSLLLELAAAPKKRAYAGQTEGLLVSLAPALEQSRVPLENVLSRAAEDAPDPLRTDLLHVLGDTQGGKPLGLAIEEWAARRKDKNLYALAAAVALHDQQGGDLPQTVSYIASRLRRQSRIRASHKAESAGERIALMACSIVPTSIYLFFAPRMPTLNSYLHGTTSGAFGVAFLAAVQVGAIVLLRLYVLLPEVMG
ncbi:MAG: type II secretion system F family protein [Peptococcaceae bacterium]|jgi:Flp pilus assembly protein TadB|nr:type II secretion system F family protein [Peptococcaceae bacterium]